MENNITKKQKIAEKLLSDQHLESSEILWLLSHLPDNDNMGIKNTTPSYRHEKVLINEALSMDGDEWNKKLFMVMDDIGDYIVGKYAPSQMIEKWLNENDYQLLKFICFMCIEKFISDYEMFTEKLSESAIKKTIKRNTKNK